MLERTILFCDGPRIRVVDLPGDISGQAGATSPSGVQPMREPAHYAPVPLAPMPMSMSQAMVESGKIGGPPSPPQSLKEIVRAETERVERELIQRALDETGGNVTKAAKLLKISRKSLQLKMKDFGLRDVE